MTRVASTSPSLDRGHHCPPRPRPGRPVADVPRSSARGRCGQRPAGVREARAHQLRDGPLDEHGLVSLSWRAGLRRRVAPGLTRSRLPTPDSPAAAVRGAAAAERPARTSTVCVTVIRCGRAVHVTLVAGLVAISAAVSVKPVVTCRTLFVDVATQTYCCSQYHVLCVSILAHHVSENRFSLVAWPVFQS